MALIEKEAPCGAARATTMRAAVVHELHRAARAST